MIDEDILALRNKDQIFQVDEQILQYRKKIHVFPRRFEQVYKDLKIEGFTDITRYNVDRFTQKMGNPKRDLFIKNGEDYRKISARKIYNIDCVARYSAGEETDLKRFRLVMNRNGIRRLEED